VKEASTTSHPASKSKVYSLGCNFADLLRSDQGRYWQDGMYAEQVYVLPIKKAASAGSSNVWVYIQYMYCPWEYGKENEESDED
jgi:hypothetical protein